MHFSLETEGRRWRDFEEFVVLRNQRAFPFGAVQFAEPVHPFEWPGQELITKISRGALLYRRQLLSVTSE